MNIRKYFIDALEKFHTWIECLKDTTHDAEKLKDGNYYTRLGWRVAIFGFGGFMLWATFAPLDKGVPASGTVVTEGYARVVQPLVGGLVEEILVKDGQEVDEGQILLKINNTQQQNQVDAVNQSLSGLDAKARGLQRSVENQKAQVKYLSEQLKNTRVLAKEGYVPRNKLLDLERQYAQLNGSLLQNEGDLEAMGKQQNELKERLDTAEFELASQSIRSPVAGSVIFQNPPVTVGSVVNSATRLFTVVPLNQPLLVEVQVPTYLIDKVHVGLTVDLMFPAFNQNTTPKIPAEVTSVSADKLNDERLGPYYKVIAQVTPVGMKKLSEHKIRPGMPVQAFIVTGERTMMNYILKPIFDRMRGVMREE